MNVYASLPPSSYSFTDRAAESLIHLRQASQSRFTKEVTARFELGSLFVRSVVDCGLHASMVAVCLTTAIVKVPVYSVLGGVTPKAALIDASSHLIRAIKLVVVAPLALLAGLLCPEWSVSMYRGAGLVKLEPKAGLCAAFSKRFQSVVTQVMQSANRQQVMGATAALVMLVGAKYWFAQSASVPMPAVLPPTNDRGYLPLLSVLGAVSILGAIAVKVLWNMSVNQEGRGTKPEPASDPIKWVHPVAMRVDELNLNERDTIAFILKRDESKQYQGVILEFGITPQSEVQGLRVDCMNIGQQWVRYNDIVPEKLVRLEKL